MGGSVCFSSLFDPSKVWKLFINILIFMYICSLYKQATIRKIGYIIKALTETSYLRTCRKFLALSLQPYVTVRGKLSLPAGLRTLELFGEQLGKGGPSSCSRAGTMGHSPGRPSGRRELRLPGVFLPRPAGCWGSGGRPVPGGRSLASSGCGKGEAAAAGAGWAA